MAPKKIAPTHAAIRRYHDEIKAFSRGKVTHELAIREAFKHLLEGTLPKGWQLLVETGIKTHEGRVVPDGTIRDANTLTHGHWEAKDAADTLDAEIKKKRAKGYPLTSIIFEDRREAEPISCGQDGRQVNSTCRRLPAMSVCSRETAVDMSSFAHDGPRADRETAHD